VTTLDRLARSVPDSRDIADELTASDVRLNNGGSIHDPHHLPSDRARWQPQDLIEPAFTSKPHHCGW